MNSETAPNFDDSPEKGNIGNARNIENILDQYRRALMSSDLFEVDKKQCLEELEKKPPSEHNPNMLKNNLAFLPRAREMAQAQYKAYEKKLDEAVKAGLFSTNSASKEEYLNWFKEQPFDEREKILKNPLYKERERKEALEAFKRLPEAERKAREDEFNKLGIEERQKLIERLTKQHQRLKEAFLKLPGEIQEKKRAAFKAMKLDERESFLKSLKLTTPDKKGDKNAETNEETKLSQEFDKKMHGLVEKNLFSPLSVPAYRIWFASLPLEKKRTALQKSDLDNPERIRVRDSFLTLPPEKRAQYELKFKNADLDARKAILASINQPVSKESTQKYPDKVIEHTLKKLMTDPSLTQTRLLFTMANQVSKLRRKAEIRYEAKNADDMAQKASARGNKVDEGNVIYLERLRHHGEDRHYWKDFLVKKKGEGQEAMMNNTTLLDKNRAQINAQMFHETVVGHLKTEFIEALLNLAADRLPGADPKQMRRIAEKLDPSFEDLRKVTA